MAFSQNFWLLVSFILFFTVAYKFLKRTIGAMISSYQKNITKQLHDANVGRIESEAKISEALTKQTEIDKICHNIISDAKEYAKTIKSDSERKIDEYINAKISAADAKISALEGAMMERITEKVLRHSILAIEIYCKKHGNTSIEFDELEDALKLITTKDIPN